MNNIKGGGITYLNDYSSNEMKIFRGGLRNLAVNHEHLEYNKLNNPKNHHDFMSYERV